MESDFDTTLYFQDGSHDVISRKIHMQKRPPAAC